MSVLLLLAVVFPVISLILGFIFGALIYRFWTASRSSPTRVPDRTNKDVETPPYESKGSETQLQSIHIVANSLQHGESNSSPYYNTQKLCDDSHILPYSADSLQPSPGASPQGRFMHARNSSDLCRLMRAGTSVLSQVLEDMDTHTALRRLVSQRVRSIPSPQAGPEHSSLSVGALGSPPGEVHMDEIDLQECIGKGGFGAVYTARWRQAPVAVKYIVCRTDNHDSLGRAIREVVLSKKMSHPNVVQCYSWTVLTQPENAQAELLPHLPQHPMATNFAKRSLDLSIFAPNIGPQAIGTAAAAEQSTTPATSLLAGFHEGPGSEDPASSLQPSPFADAVTPQMVPQLPIHFKHSCPDAGAGAGAEKIVMAEVGCAPQTTSPAIAAVRPEELAVLEAIAVKEVFCQSSYRCTDGQSEAETSAAPKLHPRSPNVASESVRGDAETPTVAPLFSCPPVSTGHSFEDALLAQFQQIASELYLSRTSSLKLSHQSTGSSSFSDVNHGFMLGDGNRTETQQSASESGWISRQGSGGSSLPITPPAAAADNPNSNPFRRSRLSWTVSSMARCSAATVNQEQAVEDQDRAERSSGNAHEPYPCAESNSVPTTHCCKPWEQPIMESSTNGKDLQTQEDQAAQVTSEFEVALAQPLPEDKSSVGVAFPRRSTSAGSLQHMATDAFWEQGCALQCASVLSLAAWQHRVSADGGLGVGGSSHPPVPVQPVRSLAPALGEAAPHPISQFWKHDPVAPSLCTLPRIPSRLGPRPNLAVTPPHSSDTSPTISSTKNDSDPAQAVLTAVLPQGSRPASPSSAQQVAAARFQQLPAGAAAELSAAAAALMEGSLQVPTQHSPGSLRGSPKTGGLVPGESLKVASRESSRSVRKQRRIDAVLEEELVLDSRTDSFNSEEGFGSPVRHKYGGVKSVFELEGLDLTCQEALMVVVMEYCDLGSLQKAIKRRAFVPRGKWTFQLTYRALLRTAQEIAKGMEYIHNNDVVHGDLKPGNVLLKTHKMDRRGYIAKVSDFGLSRPIYNGETPISQGSALGTIAYTAPEIFITNAVRKPSDVYSFGIILWEMFYCTDVYEGLIDGQICMGVSDGALRPEFDASCPWPYRSLAERCWQQDPGKRPSFRDIVKDLFIIEVDFRNHTRRNNSKSSQPGSISCSASTSRPPSPDLRLPRKSRGMETDFARELMV